jgi:iron complex transport system permease protein
MPRTACAAVVGAGLSIAGMAMQAMFKNPMASPSILGLSSGASFGACLVLAFGVGGFIGTYAVPTMAFIFCFITMFLVYGLATTKYGVPTVLLLLSGVAVGAFFSGLTSFIQYIVNSDTLSGIVYWTMGSFGRCGWDSFQIALVTIGAGAGLILFCAKELNLISLGEEQATTLGVNIRRVRWTLLIGTSLAVGGSVAICGVIGFVGLIIPHVFRSVGGPNHYTLAPLCILGGGIFMMVMDVTSKTIMSAGEIPVGVLTALLGAPFFIYIMRKHKNDIWGW